MLEFTVAELVQVGHCERQVQLLDMVLEHFQVPLVVILVLRVVIETLQVAGALTIRLQVVQDLTISDTSEHVSIFG